MIVVWSGGPYFEVNKKKRLSVFVFLLSINTAKES
jgi:hypothetical protein